VSLFAIQLTMFEAALLSLGSTSGKFTCAYARAVNVLQSNVKAKTPLVVSEVSRDVRGVILDLRNFGPLLTPDPVLHERGAEGCRVFDTQGQAYPRPAEVGRCAAE